MLARICSIIFLCMLGDRPALAQAGEVAGQWQCRQANQSVSNNRFENWMYEFGMALHSNGAFQAQGTYTAMTAGFSVPFVAQGRWQRSGQDLMARGSERRQDGTSQPFVLVFTTFVPGGMSNRFQSAQGILATHCRR